MKTSFDKVGYKQQHVFVCLKRGPTEAAHQELCRLRYWQGLGTGNKSLLVGDGIHGEMVSNPIDIIREMSSVLKSDTVVFRRAVWPIVKI